MNINELEEIFLSFSYKDEDEALAHQAFNTLYRKFSQPLLNIVKSQLKAMGIYDEQLLDAAINNTFLKIYEKPPMSFVSLDENDVQKSFQAYLAAIAKNEILSLLKIYFDNRMVQNLDIAEPVFDDINIVNDSQSVNSSLIIEALNLLSERDREIIIALYNYHEEGKKTPSEVLDILSKTYGTTKVNIRKIKQRGEEKIIEHFAKHSNLKPLKNVK